MKKIFLFCASLKLAVVILTSLIVLSVWGTLVESRYNAQTAQEFVYHSPWMYFVLALLVINLLFAMIKKFPWQKKHIPFLLAHIGILVVILGSYVTQKWGIDGSMAFMTGQKRNWMSTSDTFIYVYMSQDNNIFLPQRILSQQVHFLRNPPQNLKFEVRDQLLFIDDFYPYALAESKVQASQKPFAKTAIRFVIQNAFAVLSDWLILEQSPTVHKDFGPLRVILSSQREMPPTQGHTVWFYPTQNSKELNYALIAQKQIIQEGIINSGRVIDTPWMKQNINPAHTNLKNNTTDSVKIRLLKHLPKALKVTKYTSQEYPTDLSTSAIHARFAGQEAWIGLNSFERFIVGDKTYIVSYAENKLGIGFDMELLEFKIQHYPGSLQAASYESDILVDGQKHTISMNNPFKKNGFTFYQASFQEDESGQPFLSILSVNKDPGRFLKYFGSAILVLGVILLFVRRNRKLAIKKNN